MTYLKLKSVSGAASAKANSPTIFFSVPTVSLSTLNLPCFAFTFKLAAAAPSSPMLTSEMYVCGQLQPKIIKIFSRIRIAGCKWPRSRNRAKPHEAHAQLTNQRTVPSAALVDSSTLLSKLNGFCNKSEAQKKQRVR